MSRSFRTNSQNTLYSAFLGVGLRVIYDRYNVKKMTNDYTRVGYIPEKRSLPLSLFLTLLFGSAPLFYYSTKVSIPLILCEFLLMPFFGLNILLRPIAMFIAYLSVMSHNQTTLKLFGAYGGGK